MLMKIGILYFTTCFHGFAILRHVDPFVRMLHILQTCKRKYKHNNVLNNLKSACSLSIKIKDNINYDIKYNDYYFIL